MKLSPRIYLHMDAALRERLRYYGDHQASNVVHSR